MLQNIILGYRITWNNELMLFTGQVQDEYSVATVYVHGFGTSDYEDPYSYAPHHPSPKIDAPAPPPPPPEVPVYHPPAPKYKVKRRIRIIKQLRKLKIDVKTKY